MHVPQGWFNAYHNFGVDTTIPPEWNWFNHYFKPGDLLVHLPGTGEARPNLIDEWLAKGLQSPEKYDLPLKDTTYCSRVDQFWEEEAIDEKNNQARYWRIWNTLLDVGSKED